MTATPPEAPSADSAASAETVALATLLRREAESQAVKTPATAVREIGGRSDGPEPTRYGDWEKNGRCIDF